MSADEEGFNGASASWISDPKVLGGWDKAPVGVPIVPQNSAERSAGIPQETSLTELIRLMMEKGCPPEVILMATSLYERNSQGIPRNSAGKTQAERDFERAEERREKDRERKRLAKLKAENSAGIPQNENVGISIEEKIDTEEVDKKKKVRASVLYSKEFDSFWLSYPRTPSMGKFEAWKVWQKLPAEERALAAAAVPKFVAWLKTQKADYPVVHACRFLSKKRFDGFSSEPKEPQSKLGRLDIPPWEREDMTEEAYWERERQRNAQG